MTDNQQRLLTSLKRSIRAAILRVEGDFADGVQGDFQDALRRSRHPLKTAYEWLRHYKQFTRI